MSIVQKQYDTWSSTIFDLPYPLYFYYLDRDLNYEEQNGSVLGNITGLVSMNYTPFLTQEDLELHQIEYDSTRFGKISEIRPEIIYNPNVFRIRNLLTGSKFVAEFPTYSVNKNIGGKRNWRNEGKIYNYPYSYLEINDGINPPLVLRPELCPSTCHVGVKLSISDRCSYAYFIQNYKGDTHGFVEALVSCDATELPTTEGQYARWVATSKNQTTQNVQNIIATSKLGEKYGTKSANLSLVTDTIGSLGGAIGSALSGNIGSAITTGVSGVGNIFQNRLSLQQLKESSKLDRQNAIKSAMAESEDMKTAPNTLISQGSNIIYGLRNNDKNLRLYRFSLTEEYAERIGDYFAMFGYKQNRMMGINTKSRYYYNYIKTIDINIKSDKIPSLYINNLKSIFDKGVTIWHIDNEGVEIGNYSMDNKEV